jgi:hypothetical protein
MAGRQGCKSYVTVATNVQTFLKGICSCGSNSLDTLGICWFEISPRQLQIVMGLKIQLKLRAVAKIQAEPKRRISRNAPPIVDDLGNPVRRNADGLSKLIL